MNRSLLPRGVTLMLNLSNVHYLLIWNILAEFLFFFAEQVLYPNVIIHRIINPFSAR